jgi:O-antigen/teichoic acid export membrane protein
LSEIRVNYSGLISFAVGIMGIFTGFVFTLAITRSLNPLEFGTWNIINNFFGYIIILEPIISYWATREVSRKISSGITALITSGAFSCIGIFLYILIVYLVGGNTDANLDILMWGIILIPFIFVTRTLTAINLGFKPQISSYGLLAYGFIQIPTILFFLYYLDLGVIGVIISSLCAYLGNIVVQSLLGRTQLKNNFNFKFIKKWFKLSWIPLFPGLYTLISLLDITIFSLLTKSVIGLAFWGSAMAVAIIISQAGNISRSVYPKILSDNNSNYLKDNFSLLLYFSIPLTLLCIYYAKPLLFALNPEYMIAYPVLIFSSVFVFFNTLNTTFYSILLGTEKIDLDENANFKNYLKSKLLTLPIILMIQYGLYILVLTVGLFLLISSNYNQIDLVIFWSICALLTHFPFTIYFILQLRKTLQFRIDYIRLVKFLAIGLFSFGSISLFLDTSLGYNENLFIFIPDLLIYIIISALIYFVLTFVVDKQTRILVKNIFNELKH